MIGYLEVCRLKRIKNMLNRLLVTPKSSLTYQLLILQSKHIDLGLLLLDHFDWVWKYFTRNHQVGALYPVGAAFEHVAIILRALLLRIGLVRRILVKEYFITLPLTYRIGTSLFGYFVIGGTCCTDRSVFWLRRIPYELLRCQRRYLVYKLICAKKLTCILLKLLSLRNRTNQKILLSLVVVAISSGVN